MSLEKFHDLERMFPPGRRVRFLPTEAVKDKIPPGIGEGIVRGIVPRPVLSDPTLSNDAPTEDRFGVLVEIVKPDGATDTVVLDVPDVELLPHDSS